MNARRKWYNYNVCGLRGIIQNPVNTARCVELSKETGMTNGMKCLAEFQGDVITMTSGFVVRNEATA